jgi:broad specificity phosphatase PhoE
MSPSQRKLLLVKHAQPQITKTLPACEWALSNQGRTQALSLAQALTQYQPASLFSSLEPKAQETAKIIAQHQGQTLTSVEGLHEHERRYVGFLCEEEFHASVKKFFDHPRQIIFGEETAHKAEVRFVTTVNRVLAQNSKKNLVIVSHGTVITLFVAKFNKIDAFTLWKSLKLPSYLVLSLPQFELLKTVTSV